MFDAVNPVQATSDLDALLGSLGSDGREFELLCRWFLENDPEFRAEYERDDVAVLGRAGLGWVFRSSPPLAIEGPDPIACLAPEQGKISILGISIDGGQHI
jgi:hypothetical protein